MTDETSAGATELLRDVEGLAATTRSARHGFWFPAVLFGVLTLISAPLYWHYSSVITEHCRTANGATSCSVVGHYSSAGGLAPSFFTDGLGRWVTYYWVAALVFGYLATVLYYSDHAQKVGIAVRTWPAVTIGVILTALALWANDIAHPSSPAFLMSGDLWMRGTVSLLIVATALVILALFERSVGYVVFSLGFFGLSLLSCLYDMSNLFARIGLGGIFSGNAEALPNLLVPGLYLTLGGFICWALQRDASALAAHHLDAS